MEREGEEREERGERGDGFDDLFEDLDRFFAPDPGEASRRRAADQGEGTDQPDAPDESSAIGQRGVEGGPDVVDDVGVADEVEVADEHQVVDEVEVAEEHEAADHEETYRASEERDEGEETDRPESTSAPTSEPTAEMTGQEWSRLRDVLGEEEQDETYRGEVADVSADEVVFGYEEDEGDRPDWLEPGGGHELTLEDMKKAPPEYSDLPGPAAGAAAEAGAAASGSGEDGEAYEDAVVEPGSEVDAVAEPGAETEAEPEWPEPSIAEVEAAADQLAEEFRDSEAPSEVEEDLLADLDEPSGPRTVRVGAAESLTGPTWEEPTSQPLMADTSQQPAPAPGRNIPAAVITAGVLALVALIALIVAKAAFVVVAGAVVVIGQAELYATMRRRGHQPATALGLVVGAFVMIGAYRKGEPAIAFFVVLGLVLCFLWYMAAPLKAREDLIRNVGSTMMGVLYVPVLASYVFLLLAQPASGRALMLTVIGLTFWYDIWAFVVGSFWGSRPLAPTISPRKSWEGLLGATAFTLFPAIALVPTAVDYLSVTKAIGLAIVIVVFAPLGDLVESLIKRDLGVKDMGSLLPGHGGVLDRIDSVLLVAPAAFYFLRLIL
jgi:phosphatidate cytidylyltransferase